METKKLTEQELAEIKTLRESFNTTYSNIGVLTVRIKELEEEKERLYELIGNLKESESKIYETLKTTYGDGMVDLNTGEFTPQN